MGRGMLAVGWILIACHAQVLSADGPLVPERMIRFHEGTQFHPASSDHDRDGVDDLLLARPGAVRIISGLHGTLIKEFAGGSQIFGSNGLRLETTPDLDGDGKREILIGAPAFGQGGSEWLGAVCAIGSGHVGGSLDGDAFLYRTIGTQSGDSLGTCLGTTSSLGLVGVQYGVLVLDLGTGAVLARLRRQAGPAMGGSVAGLGDVDGDGIEDFVVGGEAARVISGTVRTSDWTAVDSSVLGNDLIATLESPDFHPGQSGGAGDREMLVDLGDPFPENGAFERLIVAGDATYDGGKGGIAAFVVAPRGDGGFHATEAALFPGGPGGFGLGRDLAAIGDVDRDGIQDLAAFEEDYADVDGPETGRVLVLSGAGLLDGFDPTDVIQDVRPEEGLRFYHTMRSLGDHDRDGLREVAVGGIEAAPGNDFVTVYSVVPEDSAPTDCDGNGLPDARELDPRAHAFAPAATVPIGVFPEQYPRSIALADLDEDGDVDLAVGVAGTPSNVRVFQNLGRGTFESTDTYPLDRDPYDLAAADFDGDGAMDLATAGYLTTKPYGQFELGKTVSILINRGDGSFLEPRPTAVGDAPLSLVAGDIDGDRDADLVVLTTPPTGHVLFVLANDGAGAFSTREQRVVEGAPAVLVDFDGDHDLDACVGGNRILSNPGDGRFVVGPAAPWWPDANGLVAGDFDGDGDQDIAAASRATYGLWVARNDGGVFGPISGPGHGNGEPLDIECLDVDGDAHLDLVTASASAPAGVWSFQNGGAGMFFTSFDFVAGAVPTAIAAGDLDRDGRPDLAVANRESSDVSILLNATARPPGRDCNRNGVLDSCDLAAGRATDYNSNGVPDSCERRIFHRGDANDDGLTNIADALAVIGFLFLGSSRPHCMDAADSTGDNQLDISDAVRVLMYLFLGGPPPPTPGPAPGACGLDPDDPLQDGFPGCLRFDSC